MRSRRRARPALAEALATRGLVCTPSGRLLGPWATEHWRRRVVRRSVGAPIVRAFTNARIRTIIYAVDVRLLARGRAPPARQHLQPHAARRASTKSPFTCSNVQHRVRGVAKAGDLRTAIHVVDLERQRRQRLRRLHAHPEMADRAHEPPAFTGEKRTASSTRCFRSTPSRAASSSAFATTAWSRPTADGRRIVIDPREKRAIDGAGWVRVAPDQRTRAPGNLVTWAVDRVRAMDFVGEDAHAAREGRGVHGARLGEERARTSVIGEQDSASDLAHDLGTLDLAHPEYTDPEIGWPPEPIPPIILPAMPGEGQWIPLGKDPFITPSYGLPSAFVTSFLRPDRDRKDTRVYVTMWDPRQIALHMQAGTVEPLSATGEAGPGQIPRVLLRFRPCRRVSRGVQRRLPSDARRVRHAGRRRLVSAAEAVRGDGDGAPRRNDRVRLVAGGEADGRSARRDAGRAPRDMLELPAEPHGPRRARQVQPVGPRLVGRHAARLARQHPHDAQRRVCLTKEGGFVGYFYGADASAEALARAMLQARCDYAVHLDMNPGLVGFELYDVETSATFKPLGRPLQRDWEYEDTFKAMPDFHYRARKMIRGMVEQNFPQYIHLDGRDFFYLTRRPILPGRDVTPLMTGLRKAKRKPAKACGARRASPQHGFPYAIATNRRCAYRSTPDVASAGIVRVDPHAIVPAGSPGTDEKTPGSRSSSCDGRPDAPTEERALYLAARRRSPS